MLDTVTPTVVTMGRATLYLGDAYVMLHRLGWVDAIVTDPPYVIDMDGGGWFRSTLGHFNEIREQELDRGFDHTIINPLLCGAVIVFCHNDQIPKLATYLDGSFERLVLCSWHKSNPMPVANKHYVPDTEFYFHAWNKDFYPRGQLADKRRHITTAVGKSDFDHPTVKPDEVMDKIITNVAGEIICDPFMDAGSTGVAAVKAGRRFIGIEHNPRHFATAVERLRKAHEDHVPP
jgi:site-specific DNA-methyltransferase (adenine-specific)